MSNYSTLKQAIRSVIRTNGNEEITGAVLQNALLSIIDSIGANNTFAGVATPQTNAGSPDQNVFYIGGAGTYTNFGGSHTVPVGSIGVFTWNGSQYILTNVAIQDVEVFDISAYNNNAKYVDLAAALNGGANIPQSLRKGGISVKFIQSSDNKYVQYRLMSDSWSITVTDWQGVDNEPTAGSDNLVKSGSIKLNKLYRKSIFFNSNIYGNKEKADSLVKELYFNYDGTDNVCLGLIEKNATTGELVIYNLSNSSVVEQFITSDRKENLEVVYGTNGSICVVDWSVIPLGRLVGRVTEALRLDLSYVTDLNNFPIISSVKTTREIIKGNKLILSKTLYQSNGETIDLNDITQSNGIYLYTENGQELYGRSATYAISDYINIRGCKRIEWYGYLPVVAVNINAVSFYDTGKNFISSVTVGKTGDYQTQQSNIAINTIPSNASFIRCTTHKNATEFYVMSDIYPIDLAMGKDEIVVDKNIRKSIFDVSSMSHNNNIIDRAIKELWLNYSGTDNICIGLVEKRSNGSVGEVVLYNLANSAVHEQFITTNRKENIEILTGSLGSICVIDWSVLPFGRLVQGVSAERKLKLSYVTDLTNFPICTLYRDKENDKGILYNLYSIIHNWGFIGDSLCSGEIAYRLQSSPDVSRYYDRYSTGYGQRMCHTIGGAKGVNYSERGLTTVTWWEKYIINGDSGWTEDGEQSLFTTDIHSAYLLALGTNDYYKSSMPAGNPQNDINLSDYNLNANTFSGNYGKIVQKIRELNSRSPIFLVLYPNNTTRNYDSVVKEFPNIFSGVFVIDLYEYFSKTSINMNAYSYLGHYTTQGYQIVSNAILEVVNDIILNNADYFNKFALIGTEVDDDGIIW